MMPRASLGLPHFTTKWFVTARARSAGVFTVERLLAETQGGGVLNTAFLERLNATFCAHLALLVRRTRRLGRCPLTLEAAVYL
jgi:hypothetical protein